MNFVIVDENGDEKQVKLLENIHDEVDVKDHNWNTPLMFAAQIGHVGIINKLLKFGANPKL